MYKIGICDDSKLTCTELENMLRDIMQGLRIEAEIEPWYSGESLCKYLEAGNRFDLIFLDIHMKYQDGMTTAKRIREVDADAQIVFITALAQYAIEGYKVNALDFILKPVVYEQLTTMQDRQCTVYFTRSQTARA